MNYSIYQYLNNAWQEVLTVDANGVSNSGTPIDFGTINLGGESQVIQMAVKPKPGYQFIGSTMPIVPSGTASADLAISANNETWNAYGANADIPIANPTDYNIFYVKRNATGENQGNGITDVGIGVNISDSECTLIPSLSAPVITATSPAAGQLLVAVTSPSVSNIGATILYDFHDDVGDLLLGNVSAANAQAGQTISVPAGTYNVFAVAKDSTNNLTAQSNTVTGVVVAQPVNNAPVISSVTISGSASVGATLTANVTGSDPDQYDTVTYAYQWLRNGVAITGATAQTYTLVSADGGNTITVTATPTDNHGLSGNPVTSAGVSVATVNNPPVISNLDWSDAVAGTGSKVIFYGSASDAESETITQIDFVVDQNSTYDPNAGTGANATYHYTKSITAIADIQAFQTSGYTWSTPGWPNSTGTYYLWARASDASGIGQYVQCGTTVKVSQSAVADPTITASMDATGNITVSVTNAGGTASPVYDILVDNVVKATGITPVSNYSLGTTYTDRNPHYVRVRARSGSAGTAVWGSNVVTVSLPDIQPTALASNQISITNVTGTGLTLAVSGSPSTDSDDPTATITYLVDIDDNTFATPTEYTWAQLASVAISQSLTVGSHTLYIKAKAVTGAKTEYSAITGVTCYVSGIKSISATAGNNQVTLNYTGSGASGATYNIYGGASGAETLLQSGVTAITYTDITAVNGTQKFYYVTEVVGGVESVHSIEVSATPQAAPLVPAAAPNTVVTLPTSKMLSGFNVPSVIYDSTADKYLMTLMQGGEVYLTYCLGSNNPRIAANWATPVKVVPKSASGWDTNIMQASISKGDDSKYYIYYSNKDIGYATCPTSADPYTPSNWTKNSGNPTILHGTTNVDTDSMYFPGSAFKVGTTWYMTYLGRPNATTDTNKTWEIYVLIATAIAGPWTKQTNPAVFVPSGSGWQGTTVYPTAGAVLSYNGTYYMFIRGFGSPAGIGLTKTTDLAQTWVEDTNLVNPRITIPYTNATLANAGGSSMLWKDGLYYLFMDVTESSVDGIAVATISG